LPLGVLSEMKRLPGIAEGSGRPRSADCSTSSARCWNFRKLTEYDAERREGFPWYLIVLPIGILPDEYTDLSSLSLEVGDRYLHVVGVTGHPVSPGRRAAPTSAVR
jgi:hypothetical protein